VPREPQPRSEAASTGVQIGGGAIARSSQPVLVGGCVGRCFSRRDYAEAC